MHFGPLASTIGGMQTVLRTIKEHSIGADEIQLVPTWSGRSQIRNGVLLARALKTLFSLRAGTIVHVHVSSRGALLREGAVVAAAHARNLPVVVSLHGNDFPVFAAARPNLVRAVLSQADYITCLSPDAHAILQRIGVRAPISIVRNPVAMDFAAPPVIDTQPVVVFAGEVGRRKGVDVLAAAWKIILRSGVQGSCRVIGPVRDYHPPALHRFSIEGPATAASVRQAIRDCRVVTLPSRSEGMPMILGEAVAAGRPFVATPVGGIEDLAPCAEMIIPVNDPEALATALTRYLVDAERASEVGTRARDLCQATRSPEVIGRELRTIYTQCLRSN